MKTSKADLRNFVTRKIAAKLYEQQKLISKIDRSKYNSEYNAIVDAIQDLELSVFFHSINGRDYNKPIPNKCMAELSFNANYQDADDAANRKRVDKEIKRLADLKISLLDKIDLFGADSDLVEEIQKALL